MNKAEFLAGLRDALAGKLPSGELEDVLSYYEEYFADAGQEHEAEAAEGLGSPASVAAQVLEGRTGQALLRSVRKAAEAALARRTRHLRRRASAPLGVGIRLVFLGSTDARDAPAAGERQPVAAGQEPVVVEQDPVSTPPENKLELEPFTALDIDVGTDIRMEEGDGWHLSLTSGGQDGDGTPYRLNHSQSGDTLRSGAHRRIYR